MSETEMERRLESDMPALPEPVQADQQDQGDQQGAASAAALIIGAMLKTQRECGRLAKGDFNAHGKYNFVSIDDYYEKVATIAAANGLTWIARCTEVVPIGEKAVKFTYSFSIMHASGAVLVDAFQHPILHPLQGAQTAGSALSYIDKAFMRHAFRVVTGEKDADSTPNTSDDWDLSPAPKAPASSSAAVPPPEALRQVIHEPLPGDPDKTPTLKTPDPSTPPAQLDIIEEVLVRFAPTAATAPALMGFWNKNTAAINALKGLAPDRYDRVLSAFTARRKQIEAAANQGGF